MMAMAAAQEVRPAPVQGHTVLVQWIRDVAPPAREVARAALSTDQPEVWVLVPEPPGPPELGVEPVVAQGQAVEVAAATKVCNA